jgi:hypothetical protein
MDKEYTPAEAKAWLNGYDEGKKIRTSERNIQTSDNKDAESTRAWVGLTDEEVNQMEKDYLWGGKEFNAELGYWAVYRAIEAKLKEKNT